MTFGQNGPERARFLRVSCRMALDILIENGIVVDGTGAPAKQASIGIAQGKIAEGGNISGTAKRTIDAGGLVVAPGFIDPHTPYDPQICWCGRSPPPPCHRRAPVRG